MTASTELNPLLNIPSFEPPKLEQNEDPNLQLDYITSHSNSTINTIISEFSGVSNIYSTYPNYCWFDSNYNNQNCINSEAYNFSNNTEFYAPLSENNSENSISIYPGNNNINLMTPEEIISTNLQLPNAHQYDVEYMV